VLTAGKASLTLGLPNSHMTRRQNALLLRAATYLGEERLCNAITTY
jgi:hypothetical protein